MCGILWMGEDYYCLETFPGVYLLAVRVWTPRHTRRTTGDSGETGENL